MTLFVVLVGILVSGIGAFGLVRPAGLKHFMESVWKSPAAFPFALGFRIALGIALLLAAPDCRHPGVVQTIGVIALVAAVAGLALGRERIDAFVAWWVGRPAGFLRAWAGVAIAFGAFLVYTAY